MIKLILLTIAVGFASLLARPLFRQSKNAMVVRPPQERARTVARAQTQSARIAQALDVFRRGDAAGEAAAWRTVAGLHRGDFRRYTLATTLEGRGRIREAYEVARVAARYNRFETNDAQMRIYARLADEAGHPEEAAWARGRMGEDGRFQVWKESQEYIFVERSSTLPRDVYEHTVNRHLDSGLEGFPNNREEIEALRTKLLAAP